MMTIALLTFFRRSLMLFIACVALVSQITSGQAPGGDEAASREPSELEVAAQGLLDCGLRLGSRNLQRAEEYLQTARRLSPKDPWIEYAWGLVLLKQLRRDDAIRQFTQIAERPQRPFWPAWQARVWMKLTARQYGEGLTDLEAFSGQLARAVGTEKPDDSQVTAAEWIGQALEALRMTVSADSSVQEQIAACDQRIRRQLQPELDTALDQGRSIVRQRDTVLAEEAEQAKAAFEQKQRERAEQQAKKIDRKLQSIQAHREHNAIRAEDSQATLEDQLIELDKQIGRLDRDYKFLTAQMQSTNQLMLQLRRQITSYEFQHRKRGEKRRRVPDVLPDRKYQAMQAQMNELQREYARLNQQAHNVAQQGAALTQKKQMAVRKHQKATSQAHDQNAELKKRSERLGRSKSERTQVADSETTPKFRSHFAPHQLQSFRSYLDLDVDKERDRILEQLATQ